VLTLSRARRAKGPSIPKWSRGTARICWLSTLLRKLHDERTRSTGALPRFGGPHEAGSHNAPSLVLRYIGLMTGPLSLGLAALVLAAGTLSLWAPRLIVAQTSALAVYLLDDQGDLQCRGQVGEVSCAFL
jgi:hypothetical protein